MFFRKINYIEWDEYKAKIDFVDQFYWQQGVRRANIEA